LYNNVRRAQLFDREEEIGQAGSWSGVTGHLYTENQPGLSKDQIQFLKN